MKSSLMSLIGNSTTRSKQNVWVMSLLVGLGVMSILSLARIFAHAPDLTSSGTFGGAIGLATPVAMAGIAGLVSERAGVVNIGLQGMMVLGTWGGDILAGITALGGTAWRCCFWCIRWCSSRTKHDSVWRRSCNIWSCDKSSRSGSSSIFIKYFLSGSRRGIFDRFSARRKFGKTHGAFSCWRSNGWFFNTRFFGFVEERQIFLISDISGLCGGFLRDIATETVVLLSIIPLTAFVLWKTPFGLRLRSSGEKPSAADSLGVNVVGIRWIALVTSGAIAGLGGAWLVINIGKYQQGQEGLRGFLGLAAVIFGNWKPFGVFLGALLFQFTESLRMQLGMIRLEDSFLLLPLVWQYSEFFSYFENLKGAVFF